MLAATGFGTSATAWFSFPKGCPSSDTRIMDVLKDKKGAFSGAKVDSLKHDSDGSGYMPPRERCQGADAELPASLFPRPDARPGSDAFTLQSPATKESQGGARKIHL